MQNDPAMTIESEIEINSKVPAVSIGMPIYNDEKYVERSLDDLLAQTFIDFELIISDNGSTDNTTEICKRYAAKDHRIHYHRQPQNNGPLANFYFVYHQARGDFFMWAASDDRWDKDFINILVEKLNHDKSYACAFSPFISVDEYDQPISGIQHLDFSGRNTFTQIVKFNLSYNDAFFYAIFRRELIKGFKFPIWWWINTDDHTNCIYPVLTYFLSRGGYVHAGNKPLWFNRLHIQGKPRHDFDVSKHSFIKYLAFLLRKVNVFYESTKSIYKGTGSIFITIPIIPVLAIKCLFECIQHSLILFLSVGKRLLSKAAQRNR